MFRRKELPYPKESYEYDEYYVVDPIVLKTIEKANVKFSGVIESKPVIEYYKTSWPWSIESRLIEEDHGHRTTLIVSGVTVYVSGVVIVDVGDEVTVWGRWNGRFVESRRFETPRFDFRS